MRILCLTSSYPRHPRDIAGRFVLEHCRVLESHGHHVDVLTWSSPTCSSPTHDAEFRVPDDRITRIRYAPRHLERLFYGAGAPENIAADPRLLALLPSAFASMVL